MDDDVASSPTHAPLSTFIGMETGSYNLIPTASGFLKQHRRKTHSSFLLLSTSCHFRTRWARARLTFADSSSKRSRFSPRIHREGVKESKLEKSEESETESGRGLRNGGTRKGENTFRSGSLAGRCSGAGAHRHWQSLSFRPRNSR